MLVHEGSSRVGVCSNDVFRTRFTRVKRIQLWAKYKSIQMARIENVPHKIKDGRTIMGGEHQLFGGNRGFSENVGDPPLTMKMDISA